MNFVRRTATIAAIMTLLPAAGAAARPTARHAHRHVAPSSSAAHGSSGIGDAWGPVAVPPRS